MPQIVSDDILKYQGIFTEIESIYREAEDMINLGLYKKGTTPKVDLAIQMHSRMEGFIKQDMHKKVTLNESFKQLEELIDLIVKEGGEKYGISWDL